MIPKQRDEKFYRQRKFFLFAPLLMIVFMSITFYGLGGGKGEKKDPAGSSDAKGLNLSLPAAHFDPRTKSLDKLGFYNKANIDSMHIRDRMRTDPYYTGRIPGMNGKKDTATHLFGFGERKHGSNAEEDLNPSPEENPGSKQAEKVLEKLEQLKKVINQPGNTMKGPGGLPGGYAGGPGSQGFTGAPPPGGLSGVSPLAYLEKALAPKTGKDTSARDPEMEKYNTILDKILRIQHPEESRGDTAGAPVSAETALVSRPAAATAIHTLGENGPGKDAYDRPDQAFGRSTAADPASGGFMDLGDEDEPDSAMDNTIRAVIDQDGTLMSGAICELRLLQEAVVNGVKIPRNNIVSGKVTVNGERMNISVSSIRVGNNVFPVGLSAYDLDGLEGLWVPGAISRDVSKETADQAINGMGLASLDPNFGAQMATAGIQGLKTLVSRKVKLIKVSVKAGQQVLLKNTRINKR
ncbi:MAG: conjugative transposon protein TraM [Puia sp.]|nr:conjugative transposon protein TraM [Puia sp.]